MQQTKQQTKSSRCAVVGCTDPHRSIQNVPASEETRAKWMDFIFECNVPERIGKILFVCANHFELDCFANLGQYNAGLATRLTLQAVSVPSIRRISDEGNASTSGQCARVHHVACQTDRPKMCTVGTQLSVKTLRPHYKSTGLLKKLVKIAQNKECEKLKKWLPSIKKHIYWTAATSTSGPERVAKWTSLLNHVQDIHSHDDPVFPQCLHPLRISRDKSKWLTAGTPAFSRLEKVLTNKRVLKDVGKLSPHYQTSSLESFHSVILRFAHKNFPFLGMLCRLYLAVLHFNENAGRPQATSSAGEPLFKVNFPKYKKGECTAKPVKAEPTFRFSGPGPICE
ncbi:uncharacterized protein LOC116222179 isoform X2 [Clupea harengus]|uniref:Uncharacterized protein LOC116222179 isoform X2 n=1 Tax=Clupea harengus TaxID=7950 RepID=A0A6P8G6M8_CLUHA|nr:uncharacterized protein LOC116222179 isoform X2 [Clupea harengus]